MKMHGLWMFHRDMQQVNKNRGRVIRWWDGEIDLAYRMIGSLYMGYGSRPVWPKISRCAFRAMRRWNIKITVESWNAMCWQIGKRMNAYPQTMNAVLIHKRDETWVKSMDEFDQKPNLYWIDPMQEWEYEKAALVHSQEFSGVNGGKSSAEYWSAHWGKRWTDHSYWEAVCAKRACLLLGKCNCGKRARYEVGKYVGREYVGMQVFCFSCYMNHCKLDKQECELHNTRKLINKLQKEVSNVRKNQNDRRLARVSGNDDVRS